jgi:hypothetical protein
VCSHAYPLVMKESVIEQGSRIDPWIGMLWNSEAIGLVNLITWAAAVGDQARVSTARADHLRRAEARGPARRRRCAVAAGGADVRRRAVADAHPGAVPHPG